MDIAPYRIAASAVLVGSLLLTGCDGPPTPQATQVEARDRVQESRPAQGDLRQRQLAFLDRLRDADPDKRTIERAMLNEQNELGLILDRSVAMDKIPDLMRMMLTQMAGEFPGEDLTVIAYAPSNPPRKIGTARLNSQTRDMTYTAAQ